MAVLLIKTARQRVIIRPTICAGAALFFLLCAGRENPVKPRDNPFDPGGSDYRYRRTATFHRYKSGSPAVGVEVALYPLLAKDTTPVARFSTDKKGQLEITGVPSGTYNLLAVKGTELLWQDSLKINKNGTTIHDDTLECPSSISGAIAASTQCTESGLVSVQLLGCGRPPVAVDSTGRFRLKNLAAGTWKIAIGSAGYHSSPAVLTIELGECTDTVLTDTIPRPAVHPSYISEYNFYYGDFHNHTSLSDGSGLPDEAYRYARYTAGFDFFAISDHDFSLSDDSWEAIKSAADKNNDDSSFVALWGFEWTSSSFGHCTVIGTGEYCTTWSDTLTDTFTKLCAWLSDRDGVAFFNHPSSGFSTLFNFFTDEPSDRFVGMELWNRTSGFEWYYYSDGLFSDDNNKSCFDEALSRGWRIGAAGSGDNHYATWGTETDSRLTILAYHCTRSDILSALRARRFYATLDKNIKLSFTINGNEMGSIVSGSSHTLTVKALDDDLEPFDEVVIFDTHHDTLCKWEHLNSCMVDLSHDITAEPGDYFYVKIRQQDGDEAISSPVWINVPDEFPGY